jgi:hypothetical protein
VSDGAGATASAEVPDSPIDVRLRALDPDGFDALAGAVLEAEGWDPTGAPEGALYALRATPTEQRERDLKVWTIHRPLAGPVDADQIDDVATLAAEDDAAVAVATSSPTTDDARAVAAEASIHLFDRDDVATVLGGAGPELLDRIRPEPDR